MYLYHLMPEPFIGSSLIPLNAMEREGKLYVEHSKKYIGREDLMSQTIPLLNCRWNDVVHFSALNPQLIVDKLKIIQPELQLKRKKCFRAHISQIAENYEAVIFDRTERYKENWIEGGEVSVLDKKSYFELNEIPQLTLDYWQDVKKNGGNLLWFPYVPHILVKGPVDTHPFETFNISL